MFLFLGIDSFIHLFDQTGGKNNAETTPEPHENMIQTKIALTEKPVK